METGHLRATIRRLLEEVSTAADGWTLAICSPDRLLQSTGAALFDGCQLVTDSIAELLSRLTPPQDRLLVLCTDDCVDGGADELIEQLHRWPGLHSCRVLVLLADTVSTTRLQRIWSSGAAALCCLQSLGRGQLLHALLMVIQGQHCLDPLFRQRLQQPLALQGRDGQALELNQRERELIVAVARGHNSREIAALQQLRGDTVRRYLSALYRKVGVRDQRGLVAWSLAQGLIRLPDLHSPPRAAPAGAEGSRLRSPAADHSGEWPAAAHRG